MTIFLTPSILFIADQGVWCDRRKEYHLSPSCMYPNCRSTMWQRLRFLSSSSSGPAVAAVRGAAPGRPEGRPESSSSITNSRETIVLCGMRRTFRSNQTRSKSDGLPPHTAFCSCLRMLRCIYDNIVDHYSLIEFLRLRLHSYFFWYLQGVNIYFKAVIMTDAIASMGKVTLRQCNVRYCPQFCLYQPSS